MSINGRMTESQMRLGNKIIDDFANGRLSRRQLVQKGGAVGMSMTLIGSIIAGCGGDSDSGSTTSAEPKRGGILQISYNSPLATENLDPAVVFAGNDALYINNVYDQLVRLTNDFVPKPQLATKWTPNADGTEWTFELRPSVQFSDGTPFTSKDVKWTFTRMLDEKVGSGLFGALSAVLEPTGIETPDDLTVVFKLTSPDAAWPVTISAKQTGIVKDGVKTFTVANSTGTGPFMFKSFKAGESFELVKNPKYWDSKLPYLDGVRMLAVSEPATLLQSVTTGQAHMAGVLDSAQAEQIKSNNNTTLLPNENGAFAYAVMDPTQKPFDDPKVVQAMKLAVDREAIVNAAFAGYATATSDIHAWPDLPSYPPDLGVRGQDIEQAKKLLADAGHPDGIDVELYTAPAAGGMVDFATGLAQVVEPAGIRIKIKQHDPATYFTKVWLSKPFYVSYSSSRAPLTVMKQYFVGKPAWPETRFSSKELDDLVAQALAETDQAAQDKLLQQAWTIVSDQASQQISAALTILWASKKNVGGVETSSEQALRLREAFIG